MGITSEKSKTYLTLIEELPSRRLEDGQIYRFVKLQCKCGNNVEKLKSAFNRGAYKYCSKDCPMKYKNYLQYIGQTHGKLTITDFLGMKKYNATVLVKCRCGNEEDSKLTTILNGYKLSCSKCFNQNRKIIPIGTTFDMLTVKNTYIDKKTNQTILSCLCDCGEIKEISMHRLTAKKPRENYTYSCGCANKKNLVGQNFGELTVIKEAERIHKMINGNKVSRRRWICNCSCGTKEKIVNQNELTTGDTKSCGCLLSSEKRRERVSGEKNPMYGIRGELNTNWNPERTHEQREKERKTYEYHVWRMAVYKRDNFTCKSCGDDTGGNLVAHHIFNYNDFPDLRYNVSNGISLCTDCHESFHSIYGKYKNTDEQLEEFINNHFPRKESVSLQNIISNSNFEPTSFDRPKPYKVTFPNGKVEFFYTYYDMKEKTGLPKTALVNSVKSSIPYIERKIQILQDDVVVQEFKSYSEAARFFGCSITPIQKIIKIGNYHCDNYPLLNEFVFKEIFEETLVERISI